MNRSIIIVTHGLVVSTLLFSCKKAENPAAYVPAETVSIAINSPYENQAFSKGDTVSIRAVMTCETEMHGCKVYIVRNNTDTLLADAKHMHGKVMTIDEKWINELGTPADLQLIVSATVDHDGNTAEKKLAFKAR